MPKEKAILKSGWLFYNGKIAFLIQQKFLRRLLPPSLQLA